MVERLKLVVTAPAKTIISLIAACLIAWLPMAMAGLPETGLIGWIRLAGRSLVAPGLTVNMVLANNVHGGSPWIINIANVVFYFVIVFGFLTANPKAKGSAEAHKPSAD